MEFAAKNQTKASAASQYVSPLGHSLRARIAAELDIGPRAPAELAKALDEPLPRVAYHCRVLVAVGWKPPPRATVEGEADNHKRRRRIV